MLHRQIVYLSANTLGLDPVGFPDAPRNMAIPRRPPAPMVSSGLPGGLATRPITRIRGLAPLDALAGFHAGASPVH